MGTTNAATTPSIEPFIISRTFDAPRDLVFKAWTEKERIDQWFGPKGSKMESLAFDFRVGGVCRYAMQTADGTQMWGQFIYREITPTTRLVYSQNFTDQDGNIATHPFAPTWPRDMLTSVTFAENAGKTTVTVQWDPLNATAEEIATFDEARAGMNQGWGGSFEQLTAYLADVQKS